MSLHRTCAVAALLMSGPALAVPQDNTGELVSTCRQMAQAFSVDDVAKDFESMVKGATCLNFIRGYMHGYRAGATDLGGLGRICVPTVTNRQLAAVYVQWGDRNAAMWHEHPAITL